MHNPHAGGAPLAALAEGFQLAFVVGALLCLAGALVAAVEVEAREEPELPAA